MSHDDKRYIEPDWIIICQKPEIKRIQVSRELAIDLYLLGVYFLGLDVNG